MAEPDEAGKQSATRRRAWSRSARGPDSALAGKRSALGALVLQRRRTGDFPPSVVSLMQSFADQSAIALENARLFDEIAQKSRELEIASQHKSAGDQSPIAQSSRRTSPVPPLARTC